MQQQRLEAGDDEAIEKQDERLAMFLQNAEFVQALKSDADFMHSLDEEQEQQAAVRPRKQQQAALPAAGVRPADEEAVFREKLRQMGKGEQFLFGCFLSFLMILRGPSLLTIVRNIDISIIPIDF